MVLNRLIWQPQAGKHHKCKQQPEGQRQKAEMIYRESYGTGESETDKVGVGKSSKRALESLTWQKSGKRNNCGL